MKKFIYITILIAICAVTVNCNHEATYFQSDSQEINWAKNGGKDSVVLHSDRQDFEIVYKPEWVNATLKDSVLYVVVDENKTNKTRSGNIVLRNGSLNLPLSIKIKQVTKASYMTIKRKTVTIGQNGEADTLKVMTDGTEVRIENIEGIHTEFKNGVLTLSGKGNKGATRKTKAQLVCDSIRVNLLVIETGTTCRRCQGSGKVICYLCNGVGKTYGPVLPCCVCHGRGITSCPECKGRGK